MSDKENQRLLLTAEDLERTIGRMAHQIWERNAGGNLALVGIRSRGGTLAQRIKPRLEAMSGQEILVGVLDIGLYRDDIGKNSFTPQVRSTDIPFDVENKDIVLVDDVLFTGRTVRSALNALMDLGRPNRVQLLILVDRGHRELPIQADFVGVEVKTYANEMVRVCMKEDDGEDGVYILRNEPS